MTSRLLLTWAIALVVSLWAVASVGLPVGTESSDLLLARAMKESLQGGITSQDTASGLRRLYGSTKNLDEKVSAAYLLTLVESEEDPYAHVPYVRFLLSLPDVKARLGGPAYERLVQLDGDYHYEHAKFDKAAEAYRKLQTTESDELRQYATLKLGWTLLNQDKAGDAFRLWLEYAAARLRDKKPLSPNVLRGLGQALTEHTSRSPEDVAAVDALKLDATQQDLVAEGMLDGRYYLTKASSFSDWAAQVAKLSFHSRLQDTVTAMPAADAADACRKLHLLEVKQDERLSYEKFGPTLAACFEASQKKGRKAVEGSGLLATLVPRLDAKSDQRFLPFSYYTQSGEWLPACLEGAHWIAESEAAQESNVPARDVLKACARAMDASDATPRLLDVIDARHEEKALFETVNSPMLFLVTGLLTHEGFATSLADRVLARPGAYRSKWLVAVLAESLASHGKDEKALALTEALKKEDRDGKIADLRDQILLSKAGRTIDRGSLDEAQKEITGSWSDEELLGSSDKLRAFTLLTVKGFGQSPRPDWVQGNVAKLLSRIDSLSSDPKLVTSVLEMGMELGLHAETWGALTKLATAAPTRSYLSGKLEVSLFEAIARGKLSPQGSDALPPGDLKLLALAATEASKESPAVQKLIVGKKSALGSDVAYLKRLERRGSAATARKKVALDELTAWVNFIDHLSKSYRKFRWASPTLYEKSLGLVEGYCSAMRHSLKGKTATDAGIPADQWKELETTLDNNLGECLEWVGSSRKTEGEGRG